MQDGGAVALGARPGGGDRGAARSATGEDGAATDPASPGAAGGGYLLLLAGFACYLGLVLLLYRLSIDRLPDRLSFTLLDHRFAMGGLHEKIVSAGVISLLVIPFVFVVELVFTGWRASSLAALIASRSTSSPGFASTRSDLACFLLWQSHLLDLPRIALSFGAALLTGRWLHDVLSAGLGLDLSLETLPLPIQYAGYFLLFTFCDYWQHRLDHWRFFWPIHRYHHAAEDFNILTSRRVHPAMASRIIALVLPLASIDAPVGLLAFATVAVTAHRHIIHSRIESDFGWIGSWLLQSPLGHRLHHLREHEGPAGNLSLCPIWDRLFGTWRGPGRRNMVIGVPGDYRHGAWVVPDMWRDYRDFLAELLAFLGLRKRPDATD